MLVLQILPGIITLSNLKNSSLLQIVSSHILLYLFIAFFVNCILFLTFGLETTQSVRNMISLFLYAAIPIFRIYKNEKIQNYIIVLLSQFFLSHWFCVWIVRSPLYLEKWLNKLKSLKVANNTNKSQSSFKIWQTNEQTFVILESLLWLIINVVQR